MDKSDSWIFSCLMLLFLVLKQKPSIFILPPHRKKTRKKMDYTVNIKKSYCSCPFLAMRPSREIKATQTLAEIRDCVIFGNIHGRAVRNLYLPQCNFIYSGAQVLYHQESLRADVLCVRTVGGGKKKMLEFFLKCHSSQFHRTLQSGNFKNFISN